MIYWITATLNAAIKDILFVWNLLKLLAKAVYYTPSTVVVMWELARSDIKWCRWAVRAGKNAITSVPSKLQNLLEITLGSFLLALHRKFTHISAIVVRTAARQLKTLHTPTMLLVGYLTAFLMGSVLVLTEVARPPAWVISQIAKLLYGVVLRIAHTITKYLQQHLDRISSYRKNTWEEIYSAQATRMSSEIYAIKLVNCATQRQQAHFEKVLLTNWSRVCLLIRKFLLKCVSTVLLLVKKAIKNIINPVMKVFKRSTTAIIKHTNRNFWWLLRSAFFVIAAQPTFVKQTPITIKKVITWVRTTPAISLLKLTIWLVNALVKPHKSGIIEFLKSTKYHTHWFLLGVPTVRYTFIIRPQLKVLDAITGVFWEELTAITKLWVPARRSFVESVYSPINYIKNEVRTKDLNMSERIAKFDRRVACWLRKSITQVKYEMRTSPFFFGLLIRAALESKNCYLKFKFDLRYTRLNSPDIKSQLAESGNVIRARLQEVWSLVRHALNQSANSPGGKLSFVIGIVLVTKLMLLLKTFAVANWPHLISGFEFLLTKFDEYVFSHLLTRTITAVERVYEVSNENLFPAQAIMWVATWYNISYWLTTRELIDSTITLVGIYFGMVMTTIIGVFPEHFAPIYAFQEWLLVRYTILSRKRNRALPRYRRIKGWVLLAMFYFTAGMTLLSKYMYFLCGRTHSNAVINPFIWTLITDQAKKWPAVPVNLPLGDKLREFFYLPTSMEIKDLTVLLHWIGFVFAIISTLKIIKALFRDLLVLVFRVVKYTIIISGIVARLVKWPFQKRYEYLEKRIRRGREHLGTSWWRRPF